LIALLAIKAREHGTKTWKRILHRNPYIVRGEGDTKKGDHPLTQKWMRSNHREVSLRIKNEAVCFHWCA